MSYRELWLSAAGNFLLGMLVSVVPAVAFYSLAFNYTPRQLAILACLAIPACFVLVAVDLLVLDAVLRPVRPALAAGASSLDEQRGVDRLLALPALTLLRIFGPHAITATLLVNVLIVWANRHLELGIPPSHFAVYWLMNLTIVPIGHAIYEYNATERLIQEPLAALLSRVRSRIHPDRLVRLKLASRVFLFSLLMGLAPPAIGGLIAYQRTRAAGLALPPFFFFQLAAVGASLLVLWLLLLVVVSREVGEQTHAITKTLERIADGDLDASAPVRSVSELGQIALAVNEMAAGLRDRERLVQELSVARGIQQALLPKHFGRVGPSEVTGTNQPCLDVGGDYFDLMEPEEGSVAFVIADVSGKGLGAALVTALVQGTFSTMTLGQERATVFAHVNRFIAAHSELERYVTLFFGTLDTGGRLEYVNAGHPSPLLIRRGRVDGAFPAECFPVGMFEEAKFKGSSASLEPGDTLLLYTDGVTDALNAEEEAFGFERLRDVVERHTADAVEELKSAVLAEVERFTGGTPQADDITVLVVRYCGTVPS
jgi:serine phosphatase RsbU (regulator of sigma subunit)